MRLLVLLCGVLAGCAAPADPRAQVTVGQVDGQLANLAGATCTCSFDALESSRRHWALSLSCLDRDAKPVLETSWGIWAPRRGQRSILPNDPADFGASAMIATLGPNQLDPGGGRFAEAGWFPLWVHLLRFGYEHPSIDDVGGDFARIFADAELPVSRGEMRDAFFWCRDEVAYRESQR